MGGGKYKKPRFHTVLHMANINIMNNISYSKVK